MLKSFKHKGLKKFFETGKASGIQANHAQKLRLLLSMLNASEVVEDMNKPGLRLHQLQPKKSGIYAVDVSGNYRITFSFKNGHAYNVDYLDYH